MILYVRNIKSWVKDSFSYIYSINNVVRGGFFHYDYYNVNRSQMYHNDELAKEDEIFMSMVNSSDPVMHTVK